jgi:ribokinase
VTRPPRVVVVGDVMTDIVVRLPAKPAYGSDTPAAISQHGGGSAANVAAWLAASGHRATFVGRVGDDLLGRAAVAELRDAGVDVRARFDRTRATGVCVVLVDPSGERTMLPDAGANGALSPADLPDDVFTGGDHLHLSGYALLNPGSRPAALAAVRRARGTGMTTSVDPSSAAPLRELGDAAFRSWTAGIDLCLANQEEASVLAPWGSYPAVVVKLGPGGAEWRHGEVTERVEAESVAAVDTTGAGDAFAAGFLSAWLAGAAPADALRAACALAAQAVSRLGARPQPRARPRRR